MALEGRLEPADTPTDQGGVCLQPDSEEAAAGPCQGMLDRLLVSLAHL